VLDKQRFSASPQKSHADSLKIKGKKMPTKAAQSEQEESKEGVPDPQDVWQDNDNVVMWTEPQEP
jgi:hypothetical protein